MIMMMISARNAITQMCLDIHDASTSTASTNFSSSSCVWVCFVSMVNVQNGIWLFSRFIIIIMTLRVDQTREREWKKKRTECRAVIKFMVLVYRGNRNRWNGRRGCNCKLQPKWAARGSDPRDHRIRTPHNEAVGETKKKQGLKE